MSHVKRLNWISLFVIMGMFGLASPQVLLEVK